MLVKDPEIFAIIAKISEHYKANVGNRYLKPAFSSLPLDQQTWSLLDSVTEKFTIYVGQSMHLEELYDRILAVARFIFHARRDLQPNLRAITSSRSANSPNDRVLRDMAVSNFASNLNLLSDQVGALQQKVASTDEAMNGKEQAVYRKLPQMAELPGLLQAR